MVLPSITLDASPSTAARRQVLWIGSTAGVELSLAHAAVATQVDVNCFESPQAAVDAAPPAMFAILAADRPGRYTTSDALLLSRARPLMPIVSVASSLVDGRRRSGPPLPGIEEMPWHDLPGRCGWWLSALDADMPIGLGLPATARREERLLESIDSIRRRAAGTGTSIDVAVAATRFDDVEPLCDLLALTGHRVANRQHGRPRLDESAGVLVWDIGDPHPDALAWLGLLAANRPGLFIVLLDSFPRGDTTLAAVRAGAAAVLGRPVSLEALAGTLSRRVRFPLSGVHNALPSRPR